MEYLYLAMFLQAVGKDVNEINIKSIFNALNLEIDSDKVKFFIPALSILAAGNSKKSIDIKEQRKPLEHNNIQSPLQKYKIQKYKNYKDAKKEEALKYKDNVENKSYKENPVDSMESKAKVIDSMQASNSDNVIPIKNSVHKKSARYVYGIADKGISESLGNIGIEAAEVYTIPHREMCIVVHDCMPEPYQSEDEEVVKNWLFTQQEVLDVVVEKFGVVIPMSFDMIIEGKNGNSPEVEVKAWLEKGYNDFYEKILKFRNKQEYGVQVMVDTEILSEKLMETDEELRNKKKAIDAKPQGIAYMERELLKDLIKEKMEQKADQYFKEFYAMIKNCTEDIVIGKGKVVGGTKKMIMNLSCLVKVNKVEELGGVLEIIEKNDDISVRFSGPWAPFSFVTAEKA